MQKSNPETLWAWAEHGTQAGREGAVALGNPKVALKTPGLRLELDTDVCLDVTGQPWTQATSTIVLQRGPGLRPPSVIPW